MKLRFVCIFCISGLLVFWLSCGAREKPGTVVVYAAQDQLYSEPIFRSFEQHTGIHVKPVYDTEAVKSVGLVTRLINERNNPQCDVFWNNEIARTILLKKMGILERFMSNKTAEVTSKYSDSDGYWVGFAGRLRVIVYNTELLSETEAPHSVYDFTKPEWKGKLVIAYPLFGTTEVHLAALKLIMGEGADDFFRQLIETDVAYLDGNALVVSLVAQGEYVAGFTDTDDAYSAQLQGKPVGMIFPDQDGMGAMLIPNTAAMVKGCPHPKEARELIEFLTSEKVQIMLAKSSSVQIPLLPEPRFEKSVFKDKDIEVMDIDYEKVAEVMKENRDFLKELFVR